MNYAETLQQLYRQAPAFQQIGGAAYKPGLETSRTLDCYFEYPHRRYRTLHVGGTNGKGSTSHLLAAVLQRSGYRVGLYTSPHLVDFRERIRVDGVPVPESYVVSFVDRHLGPTARWSPSFFELTMMMAFCYFAEQEVDVAVVEVGMGGRLDSTNIIEPDLSVITNISFDHTRFLGDTLPLIAREKAGIIKHRIPVVIGKADGDVRAVFVERAAKMQAPVHFAQELVFRRAEQLPGGRWLFETDGFPPLEGELGGLCQRENAATVLTALRLLREQGYAIPDTAVQEGFARVVGLTGLQGRWQTLREAPRVICDTGHNTGGMVQIVAQLEQLSYRQLHLVVGMVNDKDISGVLALLPPTAVYYFTQASVPRAQPAAAVQQSGAVYGLYGTAYPTVGEAYEAALAAALPDDLVFVGGSTFVVADLLSWINARRSPRSPQDLLSANS